MLLFLFKALFYIGVNISKIVCSLFSIINYFRKPQKCPAINDSILLYSASALAEMIRKREVTSEFVVKTYIARIKEVNPVINAVVEERFDKAIHEAKYVDQMLAGTKLTVNELEKAYPLLGLPLTVKESLAVEGLSHCAGRTDLEGRKALKDADVVKRCKEAGAIPLLVSNTPEASSNFETYNNVTGKTNNPYDTRRTAGGSSGGEAALLGSGSSLIGLGSDIYGSIRLPAHYCGVWGHKPSTNIVSVDGHHPSSKHQSVWKQFFNVGPLTRYSVDLSLMMKVIAEKDYRTTLRLNEPVKLEELKFYYMENDGTLILSRSIDRDILQAMEKLTTHFHSKYGCKVEKLQLEEFKDSWELSFIKLFSDLDDIEGIFENKGKGSFMKIFQYFICRSKSSLLLLLYGGLKRLISFFPESTTVKSNKAISQMKGKLKELLGNNGVLLYPCHPTAAHFHYQMFGKIFDFSYVGIFNCLGIPVTCCTLGLNSKGLPIGIQVIAGINNDRLTLAVAQEIEEVFGGWKPPVFSNQYVNV